MSCPVTARRRTVVGVAAAALGLSGCGVWAGTAEPPTVQPGELAAADGRPCPTDLPLGEDPSGLGFGTERAAAQLPHLLEPQEAWVCQYDYVDPTVDAGVTERGWRLTEDPRPVAAEDLPVLRSALDSLALVDMNQACTSDLGPRWMVAFSHDGDLTGVVVDDYGCRSVRLTDDPHATPPGADDQDGTVGGVLDGGSAVLEAVQLGR